MRELEYRDFSPLAKKGAKKFSKLSSTKMMAYGGAYTKKTGKRWSAIDNKESFYKFVARKKI